MKKIFLLLTFVLFLFAFFKGSSALALVPVEGGGGTGVFSSCNYTTPSGEVVATLSCVFPLLATIINWLLLFSAVVTVVFIIISGIKFITSNGDAKRIDSARKTAIFAVAGLVLIFLSFSILRFIAQITGVACISPTQILSFTSCI